MIGIRSVRLSHDYFISNHLRSDPTTSAQQLGMIPAGDVVIIMDGFTCADNALWWQVDYQGVIGWTVENVGNDYGLVPVPTKIFAGIRFILPEFLESRQLVGSHVEEHTTQNPYFPYQPESIQFVDDDNQAVLQIHPLNGFMQIDTTVAGSVAWLAGIIAEQPDLSNQYCLPYPNRYNGFQDIAVQSHYINIDHLHGIAYLTRFSQQWQPYASDDLMYTFQGFYDDNYVSLSYPVIIESLPEHPSYVIYNETSNYNEVGSKYEAELDMLTALQPADISPSMESLDSVIRSLYMPPGLFASQVPVDMNAVEPLINHNCYPGLNQR